MYLEEPFVFQPSSHLTENDLNIEIFDDSVFNFTKEEKMQIEEEVQMYGDEIILEIFRELNDDVIAELHNEIFDDNFTKEEKMHVEEEVQIYDDEIILEIFKELNNDVITKKEDEMMDLTVKKNNKKQKNFDEMFTLLKGYKSKYGFYPKASKIQMYKNQNIYKWVISIKKMYVKKELNEEYIKEFDKLQDWEWDYNNIQLNRKKWMQTYERIKKYEHTNKLHGWMYRQKLAYKKKKLNAEYIALLEKIPQWTWTLSTIRKYKN